MTFLTISGIVLYIFIARVIFTFRMKNWVYDFDTMAYRETSARNSAIGDAATFSILWVITIPFVTLFKAADFVANYDKFTVEFRRKDES